MNERLLYRLHRVAWRLGVMATTIIELDRSIRPGLFRKLWRMAPLGYEHLVSTFKFLQYIRKWPLSAQSAGLSIDGPADISDALPCSRAVKFDLAG